MDKKSNQNVDWGKHYDYYETNFRNNYKTRSAPQNILHYTLLKAYLKKQIFRKDMVICEIGFGGAVLLRLISKIFDSVIGLDISPKNIELTREEFINEKIENIQLDVSDIMILDERRVDSFDIITFVHGLEHFSNNDYPTFFHNIREYLKKGGFLTGALPYKNPFNYRMCPSCSHVFEYDGHISSHDLESLRKVLEENGFEIIFLKNFNKYYQFKNGPFAKRIYRFFFYYLLKKNSNNQIEFIARKIQ